MADLDSKVSVVGAGEYLELWNPARLEESFEALRREGVSSLGKRIVEAAH
jgi:DNA-binding transcriptional regulator/RsmH inhibitor MraZ